MPLSTLTRRYALTLAAAGAALALSACQGGGGSDVAEGEMTLGRADAPVTVIEYASVTCVHCATWNADVWPAFKKKYVDSGQVRYVFREILTPPYPIASAGFLLARCAGKEKYFEVVDALFRSQQQMATEEPRTVLLRVAQSSGMTEAQFNACVTNEEELEALNGRVERWSTQENVNTTPTFVIGDTRIDGAKPLESFDAIIQPLLAKKQAPAAGG
jgi:protein-disulfide isomerase